MTIADCGLRIADSPNLECRLAVCVVGERSVPVFKIRNLQSAIRNLQGGRV